MDTANSPAVHRGWRWLYLLERSTVAGVIAAGAGLMVLAFAGAASGSWDLGTAAATAAVGIGVAVSTATFGYSATQGRRRILVAFVAAAVSVGATLFGLGWQNLVVMRVGLRQSCAFGLGRCLTTGVAAMPIALRNGPVQRRPVVRLVLWGTGKVETDSAEAEERHAGRLAQPLLFRSYGVGPAVGGGIWRVPSTPQQWMRSRHESRLSPADLRAVVAWARRANRWPDSTESQWWLATGLTAGQLGISGPNCADHRHVAGVRGVVVRLALGSCALPASRVKPSDSHPCAPVAAVGVRVPVPQTIQAGVQLLIDHEFAEAATDPEGGWRVLVAPVCQGYAMLEIADVCAPQGPILSAPVYDSRAGWQPSLLELPAQGRAARCVNPASGSIRK